MMMMMRLLLLLLASSGDGGWLLLQNAAAAIVGDSSSQWWRQRRESLFGTVVVDRNDGMDSNNNAPPPADPYQQQQQRQLKSPLFSCCRLTKNGKMNNNSKSNNSLLSFLTCIRGGAATAQQGDHTDDDSDDIDLDIFEKEGDAPSSTTPPPAAASNINTLAVKIRISTGLHSPLLDQRIEFTASSKRTVSSIKQAISKTMPGRPPISCIQLRYRGRLLSDHAGGGTPTTVNDIISQNDDDEDDDDEDEDEEEDSAKLSLTCDILPPIDSKFGIEFRSKIASCSTREIIEAYCLNMAGMMYGQEEQCLLSSSSNGGWGEEGAEHETMTAAAVTMIGKDPSLNIRKRAAFLQKQLFETMFTDETKLLIEEEHARVMRKKNSMEGGGGGGGEELVSVGGRGEGEEVVVYGLIPSTSRSNAIRSGGGRGGRKASKGGATMHVKKALQKNLNVVRYVCVCPQIVQPVASPLCFTLSMIIYHASFSIRANTHRIGQTRHETRYYFSFLGTLADEIPSLEHSYFSLHHYASSYKLVR